MNMHAEKTQHDKLQSLANPGLQRRSRSHATVQLQATADDSASAKQLKALQKVAHDSRQVNLTAQLQAMANSRKTGLPWEAQGVAAAPAIQRFKNVTLETDDDDKKSLSAVGTVKDFKGGTSPGTRGWIGVTKYRAWYEINSLDGKYRNSGDVGPYQNTFTNPEAGHVLAKQNGGNGGDPENIFAQDGGTNNSKYKIFENDMRNKLNLYDDKDKVAFKCYLAGDDIEEGVIADQGLSDASAISSDEDSV